MSQILKRIFRTPEAAEYVGLAPATLEKLRVLKSGPRFIRIGRAVRYELNDLNSWLDGQKRETTFAAKGE